MTKSYSGFAWSVNTSEHNKIIRSLHCKLYKCVTDQISITRNYFHWIWIKQYYTYILHFCKTHSDESGSLIKEFNYSCIQFLKRAWWTLIIEFIKYFSLWYTMVFSCLSVNYVCAESEKSSWTIYKI
jgi:hypothetical protein